MADRRKTRKPMVEDSCGCVLCDIGLTPELRDGAMTHMHHMTGQIVPCLAKLGVSSGILDQHGVPKRTKHTMAEGPRQPEAIAAIITDIQLMRGTRH